MSIISDAKEIADLVKQLGNLELYRKIVELEGNILELTREKQTFEQRITELEQALAISKKVTFKTPFYYAEKDSEPYCPKCWETEKILVHIVYQGHDLKGHHWECLNCKSSIWLKNLPA